MASGGRRGAGVEKKAEERLPLLEKLYQVRHIRPTQLVVCFQCGVVWLVAVLLSPELCLCMN